MSMEDTGAPCKDCHEGTYVHYVHGLHCRYCGEPKIKQPVKAVQPTRTKVKNDDQ